MSPLHVVRQFVASINAHAVDAIVVAMAADHHFVDSLMRLCFSAEQAAPAWPETAF